MLGQPNIDNHSHFSYGYYKAHAKHLSRLARLSLDMPASIFLEFGIIEVNCRVA
jgi:hypothetical protein